MIPFNSDILLKILDGTERKVFAEELEGIDPGYKASVKAIAATGVPVKLFQEKESGRLYYRVVPTISGASSADPVSPAPAEKERKGLYNDAPRGVESLSGSPLAPAPSSPMSPTAAPGAAPLKSPDEIPSIVFRASEVRVSVSGKKSTVVLVPLNRADALLASEFAMRAGEVGAQCVATLKASKMTPPAEAPDPAFLKFVAPELGHTKDVFNDIVSPEELGDLEEKARRHAERAVEAASARTPAEISGEIDRLAALGKLPAGAAAGMKALLTVSPGGDYATGGGGDERRPI